jgi:hypothetical protein
VNTHGLSHSRPTCAAPARLALPCHVLARCSCGDCSQGAELAARYSVTGVLWRQDLFFSFISLYNTMMKVFFISATATIVFWMTVSLV